MKSRIWKVLAVAMAAAMIACVGAGCAKNDNKAESSAASTASTASAASKTESKDESKTESKAESKEESKTESKEESKTESTEESKEESKEESAEESKEESAEESAEAGDVTVETVAGSYEFNVGGTYIGMVLNADGTLVYRTVNGVSIPGTWELEGSTVTMHIMGGAENASFEGDKLVNSNGNTLDRVEELAVADDTEGVVTRTATSGTWACSLEDGTLAFTLAEDGTGKFTTVDAEGESAEAECAWAVSGGSLTVETESGAEALSFGISADGSIVFTNADGTHVYRQAG